MEAVFANSVKESLSLSREEAIRLGNDYIGSEHLLLGVLRQGRNTAVELLKKIQLNVDTVKYSLEQAIVRNIPEGQGPPTGSIPLTKQAERILKLTYLEAKLGKSEVIRCAHLLASILRDEDCLPAQILKKSDVYYEKIRDLMPDYALSQDELNAKNNKINNSKKARKKKVLEEDLVHILDGFLIQISDHFEPAIGIGDIASELASLINNLKVSEKGKMIGVFGNWGRGKTFLMNLVWNDLSKLDSKYNRVNFHAWKYQDTPAIWAYLYESLSEGYFKCEHTNWILKKADRLFKILKLNFVRNGFYSSIIFLLVITAISISTHELFAIKPFLFGGKEGDFKGLKIAGFIIPLTVGFVTWIQNIMKNSYSSAISLFKKYYENKTYSPLLGVQFELQKEINYLLDAWFSGKLIKDKVFLVVDDIDRCNEDKIIQVIDSLRIMLEDEKLSKKIVVIAAIDERILKLAVKKKYYEYIDKDFKLKNKMDESNAVSKQMVTEYLDKLFISGVRLGKLSSLERQELFSIITKGQVSFAANVGSSSVVNQVDVVPLAGKVSEHQIGVDAKGNDRNDNSDGTTTKLMLEQSEYEFIHNTLGAINIEITPRQIRIFYYRYLLARNLFFKKYTSFTVRELGSARNLLAGLLISRCFNGDMSFDEEENRIYNSVNSDSLEKINILGSEYILKKEIILAIISVVDLSVGY